MSLGKKYNIGIIQLDNIRYSYKLIVDFPENILSKIGKDELDKLPPFADWIEWFPPDATFEALMTMGNDREHYAMESLTEKFWEGYG